MARRFNKNDYRAIAFSLVSVYILLATVVAVQTIEYARSVDDEQLAAVRIVGIARYFNPVLLFSSF